MSALVDTHCHLDVAYFPEGPAAPLARARAAGVAGFMVVGVGADLSAARAAVDLARVEGSSVVAAVGVHPHDAAGLTDAMLAELTELAGRSEVACVGEIGLDYHYDRSPRAAQHDTFARLIALARSLGKPIVVHTRSAAEDTLSMLESERARDVGGIIHCFSEDRGFATRALELGFHLSFSGIVTFKNARAIQEVAAWAPADRILVETDSPYLAPVPFRGKPCEPMHVVHTARHIAALRGVDVSEVARTTTDNAVRLLGLRVP